MGVPYDVYTRSFLAKVTEYDFLKMDDYERTELVDGYMKRACAQFNRVCKYDIVSCDDAIREFSEDIDAEDLDEIVEIVTEGMLVQWFKQHMYKHEILENILNTTDFNSYSPAELLYRITNAYNMCKRDFENKIKDYSYNHGDLSDLHL